MDLARVHRVAAWIARGVNRALLIEQRRTRDELARRVEMPRDAGADLERFVVARGVFAENQFRRPAISPAFASSSCP